MFCGVFIALRQKSLPRPYFGGKGTKNPPYLCDIEESFVIIYEKPSNHSLFKLKKSILLVELLRHIGVWMMLIEELNGMESAAVDVEVDIPAVEIRGAGFPHFYLWMHGLYGSPYGLTDTFALNAHLHVEEG